MGIRSKGTKSESVWYTFQREFQFLASRLAPPRPLSVSAAFATESEIRGEWVFPPPFLILDRFEETAEDAGRALGAPEGSDSIDFWLDCLCLFLWYDGNREGLQARSTGPGQGQMVIDDVVQASERFSRWLSKSPDNTIELLKPKSSEPLPWKKVSSPNQNHEQAPEGGGQEWAAKKNRENEARESIVQALRELRIPEKEWPHFVQEWCLEAHRQPRFSQVAVPRSFQPPVIDRLANQSIEEWKKQADAAWLQHRDQFVRECQLWEDVGLNEKIPPPRKERGPGAKGRNANIRDRYKWAALRLSGRAWSDIAGQFDRVDESPVAKAASRVLYEAGWGPTRST
jgi:hypothetical protein